MKVTFKDGTSGRAMVRHDATDVTLRVPNPEYVHNPEFGKPRSERTAPTPEPKIVKTFPGQPRITITLTMDDGRGYEGVAICSPGDSPDQRTAKSIAYNRLIAQVPFLNILQSVHNGVIRNKTTAHNRGILHKVVFPELYRNEGQLGRLRQMNKMLRAVRAFWQRYPRESFPQLLKRIDAGVETDSAFLESMKVIKPKESEKSA